MPVSSVIISSFLIHQNEFRGMFDLELFEQGSHRRGTDGRPWDPVASEEPVRAFTWVDQNEGDFVSEEIVKGRDVPGERTAGRAPVGEDAKPDVLLGSSVGFAVHAEKVFIQYLHDW